MQEITITVGGSRSSKDWKPQTMTWRAFKHGIANPKRTTETYAEYKAMTREERAKCKDVGGFVGGTLDGKRRLKEAVTSRDLLTYDIDQATPQTIDQIPNGLNCAFYTTHSHCPESPRLRLIIPLSREATPEEFEALSRKVADNLGITEQIDPLSHQLNMVEFWASCSSDGEFISGDKGADAPFLDVDATLAQYKDWHDISEWKFSSSEKKTARSHSAVKLSDPAEKGGVIGAFCAAHPITEAIDTFLSDVYSQCECGDGDVLRYTYLPSSTYGGLQVFTKDNHAYSHHATDPAQGQNCNAFDLVRIHHFGELDTGHEDETPLPSYTAMLDFALNDNGTKVELLQQKGALSDDEFSDGCTEVLKRLAVTRKGDIIADYNNLEIILKHDPALQGLKFDEFAGSIVVEGGMPWHPDKKRYLWEDTDDNQLYGYLSHKYTEFKKTTVIQTAINNVAQLRSFNPVKEYIESAKWDGQPRVATLLIDYLGADDNCYVREATALMLRAAVARVFHPGIKFDYMMVLSGAQGIGKSMLLSRLAGKWFSDSINFSDMRDKSAAEKLSGNWIIEISEMSGLKKAEMEPVKAFITCQQDQYRAAYAHRVGSHPRQCIIFGTVNDLDGYLKDPTGARRFLPIPVKGGDICHPWNMDDNTVAQIWAEALEDYKQRGESSLVLSQESEKIVQQKRAEASVIDDRQGILKEFLDKKIPKNWHTLSIEERRSMHEVAEPEDGDLRECISVVEIAVECYGKALKDYNPPKDRPGIASMLNNLGWTKEDNPCYVDKGYGSQRVWKRPE